MAKHLGQCLKKLITIKLKKKKINLSLTDERIVSFNSNKSNQQFLINFFLNKLNNKISHQFFLKNNDMSHKKILIEANKNRKNNVPDTALIGVGLDGHIASIFEDSKKIKSIGYFSIIKKSDENFYRVSHSMKSLLKIKNTILVFRGKEKSKLFYSKIFSLKKSNTRHKNLKIVKNFIKSYKGNLVILTN